MGDYIAFLRGINLGRRRVKMEELRTLFEQLKFTRVTTFIASGNVLFSDRTTDTDALRARIEQHLAKALGYSVDVFLRTPAEVAAMANLRPFADTDVAVPGHVVYSVMLHAPLPPAVQRKVLACATAVDHFRFVGRDLYWLCQIRSSDSTVWTSPQMRALKFPTNTMRNMNTIEKLHVLCGANASVGKSVAKVVPMAKPRTRRSPKG